MTPNLIQIGQTLIERFLAPLAFDGFSTKTINESTAYLSFNKAGWTSYRILFKVFVEPNEIEEFSRKELSEFIGLSDKEPSVFFLAYIDLDKNYLPKHSIKLTQQS